MGGFFSGYGLPGKLVKIKAKDAKGHRACSELSLEKLRGFDDEIVKLGYAYAMPKNKEKGTKI